MWEVIRKDINKNIQIFSKSKNDGLVVAPIYIGNGRYMIESILSNEGGFGVIYNAKDTRLDNRRVLIKANKYEKSIFNKYKDDIDGLKKEINKIRNNTKIEFETLVYLKRNEEARMPSVNDIIYDFCPIIYLENVLGAEVYNQEPYIVMQMINGENLGDYVTNQTREEILKRRGYKDLREWELDILSYSLQIATILEGFHQRKKIDEGRSIYRIYQDLKPQNIMLTDERFITMLDFGGMTTVIELENGDTITYDELGSPGLGTVGYRAPEALIDPYRVDERVDIYSLGATMYHLLTGTQLNIIMENEYDRIPIDNLRKHYNKVTCEIVEKCTHLDREKRYRNIQEAKEAIKAAFKPVRTSRRGLEVI